MIFISIHKSTFIYQYEKYLCFFLIQGNYEKIYDADDKDKILQ